MLNNYTPFRNLLFPCLFVPSLINLTTTTQAFSAMSVAVSIKPVHPLVAGLMEGAGEPSLIVKGNRSPHNYGLRLSEAHSVLG